MCVTRAGKVVSASKGRARVEFFDGRALDEVDLCVVNARKGDFVEVFGNLALSILSPSEARSKKKAWAEVRKAAMQAPAGAL
ncbi:MAG TPA: HypC/HybG/HupF family hydrogenase formation chaperone [Nitrososphaerales archaeon]|nr:HypC/HybG/HupF family hydrogenase formation chaperone [Nitrososphaerales archaeon]